MSSDIMGHALHDSTVSVRLPVTSVRIYYVVSSTFLRRGTAVDPMQCHELRGFPVILFLLNVML
jgi:hypothetical protein